jgi:hypothetical protein
VTHFNIFPERLEKKTQNPLRIDQFSIRNRNCKNYHKLIFYRFKKSFPLQCPSFFILTSIFNIKILLKYLYVGSHFLWVVYYFNLHPRRCIIMYVRKGFPNIILNVFFVSPIPHTCPNHCTLLDFSTLLLGELHKPRRSSLCNTSLLTGYLTSAFLDSNIFCSTLLYYLVIYVPPLKRHISQTIRMLEDNSFVGYSAV